MGLEDIKLKRLSRELGKCSKCKFNNKFGVIQYGFRFADYCHVYEECKTKRIWCLYFEKID